MLMSKFDKLLAKLAKEARENGELESNYVEDMLAMKREVDELETQILQAWEENDLLKMVIGTLLPSIFAFAEKSESLEQSLRAGMAHQEGLREELGEAQTANDLLVAEVDQQNDELQQMRISATLDAKAIKRLEGEVAALKEEKTSQKTKKKKKGK